MEVLRLRPTARQRHAFAAFAVATALGLAVTIFPSATALAAPDAVAIRKARDAFDEGSSAYRSGQFELAASQFEAADAAVPSARALRMAIRSRMKAKQPARAATLGQRALARYPDDAKTKALAEEVLATTKPDLHRLRVNCSSPCVLAVDTRAVPGKPSDRWVLFLEEGKAMVRASFDQGGDDVLEVQAVGGGSHEVVLEPQVTDEPRPPAPTPPVAPAPVVPRAPEPGEVEEPGGDSLAVEGPSWIESPWVFGFWALATAGVGGATIWSGVDTLNSPGTEVVEEACAGQGTDCPEYQQGLSSQRRTNILIGATAGTAVVAAVFGLFITDWDGEPDGDDTALTVLPGVGPAGAGLGLGGRF